MKEIVREFSGLAFPKYTTVNEAVYKYFDANFKIPRRGRDGVLDGYVSDDTMGVVVRYKLGPRDILFWDYKPESSAKNRKEILFRKFNG